LFPWIEHKEACNVLTNFPVFHAEYWVYALAGLVVIVVGTLLYTVEAPIKFSSWF
jgi:ABC-type microcin C transport system permease subunit YejB